jgi:cytochrome d ubiquinol oxidase subunit I
VTAILQPLSGDRSAKHVAEAQPLKLAALEAQFATEDRAPLRIGGLPDTETQRVHAAIEIPGGLSFLAFGDPKARVLGLDAFPRDEWPPIAGVHVAFQLMVGAGTALAALALLAGALALRRRGLPDQRAFLWALVGAGPLGFVALEAGWLVTEWGRQPWVVKGLMRTAEAVGAAPPHAWPFWVFGAIYLFLGFAVVFLLGRQIAATASVASASAPAGAEVHVPV